MSVGAKRGKRLLEGGQAGALVAVAEDEFDLLGAEEPFFQAREGTVVEDGAAVDDHDAAAEFFDVVQIMRGEKDRGFVAPIDGAEKLANMILGDDVEADRWLVEKKNRRIVQQRCGEVAAHALAERKFSHGHVEQFGEAEDLVEKLHAFVVVALRDVVDASQKLEGFDGGDVPPQLRALAENYTDGFYVGGALFPGDETVGQNFAGGWHQDAGEHFDRCGFSGAVGADVANHFATADFEVYVFDGFDGLVFAVKKILQAAEDAFAPLETAVVLGEVVDRDEGSVRHELVILARGREKTGVAPLCCELLTFTIEIRVVATALLFVSRRSCSDKKLTGKKVCPTESELQKPAQPRFIAQGAMEKSLAVPQQ